MLRRVALNEYNEYVIFDQKRSQKVQSLTLPFSCPSQVIRTPSVVVVHKNKGCHNPGANVEAVQPSLGKERSDQKRPINKREKQKLR